MRFSRALVLPASLGASLLFFFACVGEDPGTPDGRTDATTPDATVDGPNADDGGTLGDATSLFDGPCDPAKPFGAPSPDVFAALNRDGGRDESMWLLPDEKTVYFTTNREPPDGGSASFDIYRATRPSKDVAFAAPEIVRGISDTAVDAEEHGPVVLEDERTAFFTKAKAGTTYTYDAWWVKRSSSSDPWGGGQTISLLNTAGIEGPTDYSENTLWFNRDGKTFRVPFNVQTGALGTITEVTELGESYTAHLSADGLRIYYGKRVPGSGTDIWTAVRPAFDKPFEKLAAVAELNTSANEWPNWISPDGCRLYITRTRVADDNDLFVATRPR
jgi:hypothetical protein